MTESEESVYSENHETAKQLVNQQTKISITMQASDHTTNANAVPKNVFLQSYILT